MTRPERVKAADIEFVPATPERWPLLERLFGGCGDARGCWCAYWYRPNRDFKQEWGDGNRRFLKRLVESGAAPGVLALRDGEAIAWCAVGPRAAQDRLVRSTGVLAAVDDAPVWSINCFVVAKGRRRQGLMRPLIAAAIAHAKARGATVVEAYPIDPHRKLSGGELYVGTLAAFREAGFTEAARRSPHRPIVRLRL